MWNLSQAADILVREDIEHARESLGSVEVEPAYSAAGDGAGHEVGKSRIGHRLVRGVARRTGDFCDAIDARRGPAEKLACIVGHLRPLRC